MVKYKIPKIGSGTIDDTSRPKYDVEYKHITYLPEDAIILETEKEIATLEENIAPKRNKDVEKVE